jgi:hypothetical protein
VKRRLRFLIGVALGVVLLSVVLTYFYDFISDKTWLYTNILQCGMNPWEPIWPKNCDFNEFSDTDISKIADILTYIKMRDYYSEKVGVNIHDLKIIHFYGGLACCTCPTGEIRVLVSKKDEAKMINSGFKKISRVRIYSELL